VAPRAHDRGRKIPTTIITSAFAGARSPPRRCCSAALPGEASRRVFSTALARDERGVLAPDPE
jgi:hypothetical protein